MEKYKDRVLYIECGSACAISANYMANAMRSALGKFLLKQGFSNNIALMRTLIQNDEYIYFSPLLLAKAITATITGNWLSKGGGSLSRMQSAYLALVRTLPKYDQSFKMKKPIIIIGM